MSFALATDTDFALHCDLTADFFDRMVEPIARAQMRTEIESELAYRRATYPKRIELGRLDPDQAERQIAILGEIRVQLPHPGNNHAEGEAAFSWADKVRELRREITMRRQLYPRWIADPKSPLTRETAILRLARMEATHELYWYLCCFSYIDIQMAHRINNTRREQRDAAGIAPWQIPAITGNPQRKLI